jgi:hypothetical protein
MPTYSRALSDPVPGGAELKSEHRIVLVEGNYLLLGALLGERKKQREKSDSRESGGVNESQQMAEEDAVGDGTVGGRGGGGGEQAKKRQQEVEEAARWAPLMTGLFGESWFVAPPGGEEHIAQFGF